MKTGEGDIIWN